MYRMYNKRSEIYFSWTWISTILAELNNIHNFFSLKKLWRVVFLKNYVLLGTESVLIINGKKRREEGKSFEAKLVEQCGLTRCPSVRIEGNLKFGGPSRCRWPAREISAHYSRLSPSSQVPTQPVPPPTGVFPESSHFPTYFHKRASRSYGKMKQLYFLVPVSSLFSIIYSKEEKMSRISRVGVVSAFY